MKLLFYITVLLSPFLHTGKAYAQSDQDEINKQIWHPFMKAYEKLDPVLFMSLHSKDLMRVELDEEKMRGYEDYAVLYRDFFGKFRNTGEKIGIRFSFTHRISDGKKAFEKGYYEFVLYSPRGNVKAYGAFTVVLKKEQGMWKIILDSDTNKDMSEAIFLSGKLLQ